MRSTRHFVLAAGLLGLAGGLLMHGGRPTDPSAEPVAAPSAAEAGAPEELKPLEGESSARSPRDEGLWRAYLDLFDAQRALGHRDVAIRLLYDAYGAALESRSWESMIAVGDGFMAMGRAPGSAAGARMSARQAYLTALIRARRGGSVEGVLRSAGAFEELPDRDVVEQCLYIAALLAGDDKDAQQKVHDARERWTAQQRIPEL